MWGNQQSTPLTHSENLIIAQLSYGLFTHGRRKTSKYFLDSIVSRKNLRWLFCFLCELEFLKNSKFFEENFRFKLVDVISVLLICPLLVYRKRTLVSIERPLNIHINLVVEHKFELVYKILMFFINFYQEIWTINMVLK